MNTPKQIIRPGFIGCVLIGLAVTVVLLMIASFEVANRVAYAPTWVQQSGRRWHEPAVGQSFEGETASWNRGDWVTILCREDIRNRDFRLYGVHLPIRGAYSNPLMGSVCNVAWLFGRRPDACIIHVAPLGPCLAAGDYQHPVRVVIREKGGLLPAQVEIFTRDGESVNEKLKRAGKLTNDQDVEWALAPGAFKPREKRLASAMNTIAEANGYLHAKKWKNALGAASRAIREDPEVAEAYHVAGAAAGQLYGLQSKESEFYYGRFIQLEPDPTKTAFVKQLFPDLVNNQRRR